MQNKNRLGERLLVAFILVALWLPSIRIYEPMLQFTRREIVAQHSIRGLRHSWGTCWNEARQYTKREFGFHEELRKIFSKIKFFGLNSTTSQDVQKAHDGWLFFTSEAERRCMHHTHPFTDVELMKWGGALENWRARLAEKDIHFLVIVAPDKHTIYDNLGPVENHDDTPSRAKQLYAYLRSCTSVQTIDVEPRLVSERDKQQLYYKTDTHWNEVGAFLAYVEIAKPLKALYPSFSDASLNEYIQDYTDFGPADLARMAGVEDLVTERTLFVRPQQPVGTSIEIVGVGAENDAGRITPRINTKNSNGVIPRLMMLRDSFATALIPLLAAQAKEGVFLWSGQLDWPLIVAERPSIVIYEIVERNLQFNSMQPKDII